MDWLAFAFLALFFVFFGVVGYRRHKLKQLIRRTLRQDTDGSWTWVNAKGEKVRSGTNPLDEMRRDEEEADI